ncbi:MAG: hypothetical protein N2035_01830 [Chthoniobacterales bacterium]|nr:hypothetical protein [Chthoniobacterales bacterium]
MSNELGSSVFLNPNYQSHLEKLNLLHNLYWNAETNALSLLAQLQQAQKTKNKF